jgi:ribulose-phosphate 3-epimerase
MENFNQIEVAPSILSADFGRLGEEIQSVRPVSKYLHVDVMDGHYVRNITVGVPVIKSIRKISTHIFDVHLMIENPLEYIAAFSDAGADIITLHIETMDDPQKGIDAIHNLGKLAGLSVHPDTPVEALFPYLDQLDLVLIMSVRPGFGGQEFIPESFERIRIVRKQLDRIGSKALLSVDGGISSRNAADVVNAGARLLVVGSAVFESENPKSAVEEILRCAT